MFELNKGISLHLYELTCKLVMIQTLRIYLVFSYVLLKYFSVQKKLCHTDCMNMLSPQYVSVYDMQVGYSVQKLRHTGCTDMVFFPSVQSHMNSKTPMMGKTFVTLAALMWFFPSMCSHMN